MAKYKYILTVIIILCTITSYAQPAQYTPMTASGYQMKRLKVDSTLHLPSFCGVPNLRGSVVKDGALAIDTCGGYLYMWTNLNGWDTVNVSGGGGAGGDFWKITGITTLTDDVNIKSDSIIAFTGIEDEMRNFVVSSQQVNLFTTTGKMTLFGLNTTTDTSTYKPLGINNSTGKLAPLTSWVSGGTTIDTTSLSNRIDTKLSISDTANMLSSYSTRINGKLNISDTSNKWVYRLTRTSGKDSIIYFVGANRFAIKDSVGTNPAPVGYYGAFQDTLTQTLPLANTAYPIKARITDLSNGVFLADSTRFVFNNAGIYNLQWSGQFQNTENSVHDVRIWVRKNNVDIIGTTGLVSVHQRKSISEFGHNVAGWNFLLDINAGDTLQFYWSATSTSVSLQYYPVGTVPPSPTTASMVVTITQQSGIMAGTGITGVGTSGNLQSGANQTLATSANGNDFTITSASNIQTFNLPVASATTTGKLSSSNWSTFNSKLGASDTVSLSNRINGKLSISDTSTMLSNYSTRINGKLNISDANQAVTAYQYLGSTIKAFPIGVTGFANATTSYAHVSTRMMLVSIYIPQTTTITGVKYIVTSAGVSYVGNANYNGFVLYDYNKSTGLCTRIDSTASDNTIWTTTGTQQKAFVAPISLPQGVYYLGVMCQGTATTFPGIAQNTALLGASTFDLTSPARITAQLTGSNVPASFNLSTSTLNTNLPILMLY